MADRADTINDEVKVGVDRATRAVADGLAAAAGRVDEGARAGGLDDIAHEVKGAAGDLKDAAIGQGRQFYEAAKSQATSFADQRKDDTAQTIADLASSLRETGKSFGDRPNITSFVGSAADGLDQLATGLKERSFAELYADAEDFCRRSPLTVGIGAAVAGFLLARFIKSTSEDLSERGLAAREAAYRSAPSGPKPHSRVTA